MRSTLFFLRLFPAHEIVCGDIDGDGDLDLAVGGVDQAQIFKNLRVK